MATRTKELIKEAIALRRQLSPRTQGMGVVHLDIVNQDFTSDFPQLESLSHGPTADSCRKDTG